MTMVHGARAFGPLGGLGFRFAPPRPESKFADECGSQASIDVECFAAEARPSAILRGLQHSILTGTGGVWHAHSHRMMIIKSPFGVPYDHCSLPIRASTGIST